MGLDNIPHQYPCSTKGTAVLVPRLDREGKAYVQEDGTSVMSIDCQATQACGGCQWKNAEPPTGGRVLGIMGTDCWYRGKYGNALLEKYGEYDEIEGYSFYGSNADGSYKTASECMGLSAYIETLIENTDWDMEDEEQDQHCAGLEYAAWWLRWVATEADGTDCWY